VNGYLTRLAARASGRPAGATLASRPTPAITNQGGLAAEADEVREERLLEAPGAAVQAPEHASVQTPTAARAAGPAATPARQLPEPMAPPLEPDVRSALIETSSDEPDPAPSQPEPAAKPVAVEARPPRPLQARAQPSASPTLRAPTEPKDATEIDGLVELRPHQASAVPPLLPHAKARGQSDQTRVEVRIGRVEVRPPRPAPPAPAAPPSRLALAPDPFARLAAARRYVDRVWS
jgi:hypothetical protein